MSRSLFATALAQHQTRFGAGLAMLLTISLIAPSALLVIPQRVHAQAAVAVVSCTDWTCIKTAVESTITAIQSTITAVAAPVQAAADVAQWTNTFIFQPLAFVLSGNLMKLLTAGVVSFVIGKTNGTGAPQFAVDVMKSLQTVSDSQALAYINGFGRNSNSPFAYSISSALRTNYLSKTSLAGFWAANMNTLARSSPNQDAFLSGRWTQGGGVAAWFALTTRTENNPYTLYQASQSQLSMLVGPGVGGATGARVAQLGWGQGFMSWCGPREGTTEDNDGTAMEETTTEDNDGTAMEVANGVNPGDPCTDPVTGAPGTIKTPGSTIKATLDKVLGGQQDQIVRMGNVGPQINQILGNIATVLETASFAAELLGGPDSGGLFGVGQASGANSMSRLMQYAPTQLPSGGFTSGYLGVSNSNVYQSAATAPVSGTDMVSRVTQYEAAWGTITNAANAASAAVTDLKNSCAVQASAAQVALTTQIAPVLARAASASTTIAAANAAVLKLRAELAAGGEMASTTYAADIMALQTMPPSATDFATALQEAQAFGTAAASPAGSLAVSGGTLLDRMSLISTNAAALKAACTTASVDTYQATGQ